MRKLFTNFLLFINSSFNLRAIDNTKKTAIMLYEQYNLISNLNRAIIALVTPQVGHGIPTKNLIGHFMSKHIYIAITIIYSKLILQIFFNFKYNYIKDIKLLKFF